MAATRGEAIITVRAKDPQGLATLANQWVLVHLDHSRRQNTPLLGTVDARPVVSGSFGGQLGRFVFGPAAGDLAQHGGADKLAQGLARVDHCADGIQVVPSEVDDDLVFAQDKGGLPVDPRDVLWHGASRPEPVLQAPERARGRQRLESLSAPLCAAPRSGRLAAMSASGVSYQGRLT